MDGQERPWDQYAESARIIFDRWSVNHATFIAEIRSPSKSALIMKLGSSYVLQINNRRWASMKLTHHYMGVDMIHNDHPTRHRELGIWLEQAEFRRNA